MSAEDYADDGFEAEDHDASMVGLSSATTSTVLDSSKSQHELQEKFLANETARDEFMKIEEHLVNSSPLYASDSQAKIVIPEVGEFLDANTVASKPSQVVNENLHSEVDDVLEVKTILPTVSTSSHDIHDKVTTPQKISKGLACLRKRISKHQTHKDHLSMESVHNGEEVRSETHTNKPPSRPNVKKGFLGKKRLTSNPKVEAFTKQEEEDLDFLEGLLNGKKKGTDDGSGNHDSKVQAVRATGNSKPENKRSYYPKGLRKDIGMPVKKKAVRSSGYGQQPRKARPPPTTTSADTHNSHNNHRSENSRANLQKGARNKDKTLSLSPSELAILGMDSNDPIGRVLKEDSPSSMRGGNHIAGGTDNEVGEYDDYDEDFEEDNRHNDHRDPNTRNDDNNHEGVYEKENDSQFSVDDGDADVEAGPESSSHTLPGSSHNDDEPNTSRQHSPISEYKHRNHLTEEQRLEQEKFLEANENDPLIVSPRDLEDLNRDTLKQQAEREAERKAARGEQDVSEFGEGLRLVHSPKSPTTDNDDDHNRANDSSNDSNNNNNNNDNDDPENNHDEESVDAFADTRYVNGNRDGDASHSSHNTDTSNGNLDKRYSPNHSEGQSSPDRSASPTVDPSTRVVPYKGIPGVRLGNPHSHVNTSRQSQSLPNTSRRADPSSPSSPTNALGAIERDTSDTVNSPVYTRSRAPNSGGNTSHNNKVVHKSPMLKRKTYETAKTLKHKPPKAAAGPPHGNDEISVGGTSRTSPTRRKIKSKPYKKPPSSHFYDEKTGLFSSFEVQAGRESRRETYLIRSLEKKMETLQEVERMRSQNEARSIYEKAQQEVKQQSRKQNIEREKMHQRIIREQEEAFERMLRKAKEENIKLKHELKVERTRGAAVTYNKNSNNSHYYPKKPSHGAAPGRHRPGVHGRRHEEDYHHDYYSHSNDDGDDDDDDDDQDDYYHEQQYTHQYDHHQQQDLIDDGHDHHTQHTNITRERNNSHPVAGDGSSLVDNEGSGSMYYAISTNNEGEPVIRHNGSGSMTESIIVSGLDGESASVTLQPSVDEGSEGIVDVHTHTSTDYQQPESSAHANDTTATNIATVNGAKKHIVDTSNDDDMDLVEMLYSGHQNANKNTKNGKKVSTVTNSNASKQHNSTVGNNKIPRHPHQRAAPVATHKQSVSKGPKLANVKSSGYAQVPKKVAPAKYNKAVNHKQNATKNRHEKDATRQHQQQHAGKANGGYDMDWTAVPITLNSDVIPGGPGGDNGGGSIVSIGIAEDGSVIVSKSGSHPNSREKAPSNGAGGQNSLADGNSLLEGSSLLYYDIPSVGDTDQAIHGLAPTEESPDAVLNGPMPHDRNNIIMVTGEYGEDAFGNPISRNGSVAGIEGLDGYSSVQITDWGGDDDDDTLLIQQQAGGAYPGQQHGLQGTIIGQQSRSQENSVHTNNQGQTDAHTGYNESLPSYEHTSQGGGITIETSDLESDGNDAAHDPPSSSMHDQEELEGRMSTNRRISTRGSSRSTKPLTPFEASREGKRILTTSTTNNLDISTRTDEALLLSQNSDNNHNEYEEDFEQDDGDHGHVETQKQYQMQRTVENSSYEALKIVRKQLHANENNI